MNSKFKVSLVGFIVASLFLHFAVLVAVKYAPDESNKKDVVEIEFISPNSAQKAKTQIVEQEKQYNDETPEDAKYLSKHNQTFKKQTRAENVGANDNSAGFGTDNKKPQRAKVKKKKPKQIVKGGLPTLRDLKPDYDFTDYSAGKASTTDDYLREVDTGRQTLLSTREFMYYSYYQRIKEKLRRHWGSKVRQKVRRLVKTGRSIASNSDRITKVIITLNDLGTLVRVQVVSQSGVIDLDEAAVEAFKEAAPFPNPPRGMIDTKGHVTIHWDFVLEA